jgi:hypothetical protein
LTGTASPVEALAVAVVSPETAWVPTKMLPDWAVAAPLLALAAAMSG